MAKPLENRLRDAVAAGDFTKAGVLWLEVASRMRCELAEVPVPAARLRQMSELIGWCRTMAIVNRARCQRRLQQLAVSSRYLAEPTAQRRRLLARF